MRRSFIKTKCLHALRTFRKIDPGSGGWLYKPAEAERRAWADVVRGRRAWANPYAVSSAQAVQWAVAFRCASQFWRNLDNRGDILEDEQKTEG